MSGDTQQAHRVVRAVGDMIKLDIAVLEQNTET